MRKILNFIVLLILIKRNNIKEKYSFFEKRPSDYYCFDKYIIRKRIYDSFTKYEITTKKFKKYKFNLWNWQAKVLYKMAKNKYFKSWKQNLPQKILSK
jgi:hypothetical protein